MLVKCYDNKMVESLGWPSIEKIKIKNKVVKYDALDASGKHSLVWYKLFCTSFNGNVYGTKWNLNTD